MIRPDYDMACVVSLSVTRPFYANLQNPLLLPSEPASVYKLQTPRSPIKLYVRREENLALHEQLS